MEKPYSSHKEIKKSFALKGMFVLMVLALIFTLFMVRYALSGTRRSPEGVPDSDDAYAMAKEFVKPTIKASNISFPESDYQCAQKPDSVFIIKSYAESKDLQGSMGVTSYEITLRFFGGNIANKDSWKVISLNEN
ncbi:MAG: hypothetical protein JST32_17835 [Bacteroidetes bacterium]|nr:hypothetical protein [Bacteroidota bacterium]